MTHVNASTLVAAILVAGSATSALAQGESRATAVLELFTSQGCSSCPAADALLAKYAQRPGVMALTLNVDYWDHLGWKDTLGKPLHTKRQKSYAHALNAGNVYTPQLVVNGVAQAVGSKAADIEKAIATSSGDFNQSRVGLSMRIEGNAAELLVGAKPADLKISSGTIWLAVVEPNVEVEIKRGENRGKTIVYTNVVRELTPVGMWSGQELKLTLPSSAALQPGRRCAVMLQAGETGRIISAAWMAP